MQSGQRRPWTRGRGFTLIELLVVISIIMLLAALALPVLMRAVRQARAANCIVNIKQLLVSFRAYVTVSDGVLPGTEGRCEPYPRPTWLYPKHPWTQGDLSSMWPDMPTEGQLFPYYREPKLILCPADNEGNGKLSYSVPQCTAHHHMDNVHNSKDAILLMEEHPRYNIGGHSSPARREGGFGCSDRAANRHSGRTSVGFYDGHAELYQFPTAWHASELYVDPWGNSCGWNKTAWHPSDYPHGPTPGPKTW
jgi:prepilin-type N-terminal cleavage/methylation domain-containing protein/prepilin-type processing-associated H-X9-DG protein